MVFGSPKQRNLLPGVSREEGTKYAVEVLRTVMPALAELGVVLALEPLSPRTTNFMTTAAEAVEVAELVDSPNCRLLLDCLAMSSESTPIPDLIRRHGKWLVHFHANDRNSQGPGMGDLDFVPIFRACTASTTAAGFPSKSSTPRRAAKQSPAGASNTCGRSKPKSRANAELARWKR